MSFADAWFELAGELDLPAPLVQTKLQEALEAVYDDAKQRMWSFQLKTDNFLAPGLLFASGFPFFHEPRPGVVARSRGFIFAQPYSNEIQGDEEAVEAWRSHFGRPLLTECQIRSPFFSLYDIVHFDRDEGILVLDRPWMEPNPGRIFRDIWDWPWPESKEEEHWENHPQPYMLYQAYFPAPVKDFKRFFEIKDTMMSGILDYWTLSQRDLSLKDPQRVIFDLPAYAVFFDWDTRGEGTEFESATVGHPRYELWPHPLSTMPYTFSYLRSGPIWENPGDTLPRPLTEEMVKYKAREFLYAFKEAQKGETVQRGSAANFQFLSEYAAAQYQACRDRVGKKDTDLVDLFFNRFVRNAVGRTEPFATITGGLNVGGW